MDMYKGAFGPKIYLLGVIGKCKWHLGVGRLFLVPITIFDRYKRMNQQSTSLSKNFKRNRVII